VGESAGTKPDSSGTIAVMALPSIRSGSLGPDRLPARVLAVLVLAVLVAVALTDPTSGRAQLAAPGTVRLDVDPQTSTLPSEALALIEQLTDTWHVSVGTCIGRSGRLASRCHSTAPLADVRLMNSYSDLPMPRRCATCRHRASAATR